MLPRNLTQYNLGRIVPAPGAGSDTSPTYTPPRLYIVNAGATGLAANQATRAGAIALTRSNETNTGSPNPQTAVGSAGTAGLTGAPVSKTLQIIQPTSTITGANGQSVSPLVVRRPKWLKPALLVGAGFVVGWMVFK